MVANTRDYASRVYYWNRRATSWTPRQIWRRRQLPRRTIRCLPRRRSEVRAARALTGVSRRRIDLSDRFVALQERVDYSPDEEGEGIGDGGIKRVWPACSFSGLSM